MRRIHQDSVPLVVGYRFDRFGSGDENGPRKNVIILYRKRMNGKFIDDTLEFTSVAGRLLAHDSERVKATLKLILKR